MSTTVASYRARMLASRAAKAGCTVDELLARSEREAARSLRVAEIRFGGGRVTWPTIARNAEASGRSWAVIA